MSIDGAFPLPAPHKLGVDRAEEDGDVVDPTATDGDQVRARVAIDDGLVESCSSGRPRRSAGGVAVV